MKGDPEHIGSIQASPKNRKQKGQTLTGPRGIYAHPIVQKCDTHLKVIKQLSLVTENFIPSHQWSYGTRKLKLTVALGMNFFYWFSFFLIRLLVADENYKNLDWWSLKTNVFTEYGSFSYRNSKEVSELTRIWLRKTSSVNTVGEMVWIISCMLLVLYNSFFEGEGDALAVKVYIINDNAPRKQKRRIDWNACYVFLEDTFLQQLRPLQSICWETDSILFQQIDRVANQKTRIALFSQVGSVWFLEYLSQLHFWDAAFSFIS